MTILGIDRIGITMDRNYKSIPLTSTVIASLLGGCKFVEQKISPSKI